MILASRLTVTRPRCASLLRHAQVSLTLSFPLYLGLCLFSDSLTPVLSLRLETPWDWPLDAPLTIKAKARPFPWADAWRLPDAPLTAAEVTGPERELTLVPYGNTKVLRISMFPYLASGEW